MFKKIKDFIVKLFKKIDAMFSEEKQPTDWSLTSFITFFCVVIPITLWVILSVIAGVLLAIPEGILAIVIAGLTGKVIDKNNKMKNDNV